MALFQKKAKDEKPKKASIMDIRVFAVLMVILFVVMVVLIAFGVKGTKETENKITKAKEEYKQNQLAIANLKALQSKSGEFEAQRDTYVAMIPETQNLQEIMIEMENRIEENGCILTEITFGNEAEGAAVKTDASGALVKEQMVNLSVRGKYEDILKFAKSIVEDEQFMRVDGIRLVPGKDGKMDAQITIMKFSKR